MARKQSAREKVQDMRENLVDYENAMREGAESTKSGDILGAAIAREDGATGLWDDEFKAFVDAQTLKHLFFSEDWVFIVVDLVAWKIASQALKVMTGTVIDGQFTKKPAEGHPVQDLIDQPNPFQSYTSWMYCLVVDLVLLGNAIEWYAPGSNILMTLPGENISLDIDASGNLAAYKVAEYIFEAGKIAEARTTTFPADQVVHLRRPNPSSLLWGLSPFIPGRKSVLFNRYSADYLNSFYLKGAMPGFALEMGAEANERVAMRLLRSFENAYTGRRNMRRTLVLPKGVSLKETSHTLADQNLSVYVDKNRENIINLLKVPKHELSLQEAGSLGSEEAKTALKNFWYATLIPMMKIVEGELTKFFIRRGLIDKGFFVEFDLSDIDALQDDEAKKAELAEKMLKTHTLNEVRKTVYNLGSVDGGDVVTGYGQGIQSFQPFGLGFSGGRTDGPMLPASMQAITVAASAAPQGGDSDKDGKPKRAKAAKDKLSTYLKSNDAWFSKRELKLRQEIQKGVSALEKSTLRLFADMAVAVIKATRSHLKEKNWDAICSKAEERAKVVGKAEMLRRIRKALDRFEPRWLDDNRKALLARVDAGYGAALELPFNMPSQAEIEGSRARADAIRKDALDQRSQRTFAYMNETTLEGVLSTIDKGIESGATVQEISNDLRAKFSDIAEIGSRAMTIARTETLTAVSLGQAAAMADAAKQIPDLKKMWISADDDRVRDSHEQLHGDVVAHDSAFENGLQFPRDPSGPAAEVINCRCTWIMVPAEQMNNIDDSLAAEEEAD